MFASYTEQDEEADPEEEKMAESNVAQELTNEVLNTITKSQAAVVNAIETWASAVQSIKPDLPAASLPFADKLPTPQDVVASAYNFAEQLLASQRKFAEDLLTATAPLLSTGTQTAK
ncbi:MAG TPA: hypothetical protein VK836_16700 [Streptosporangiaceae bacterium]|jgi:hypothetical protein|nr:hypothetical protein [Streptosporangiaceae bacterium]